jgi:hypothetical protein
MWKYLFFLLYKCLNFCTKKFVYSIWQTTTIHYLTKVSRLSTIRRKSKTLSYLDYVLCSMNRPLSSPFFCCLYLKLSVCTYKLVLTSSAKSPGAGSTKFGVTKLDQWSKVHNFVEHMLMIHTHNFMLSLLKWLGWRWIEKFYPWFENSSWVTSGRFFLKKIRGQRLFSLYT